MLINTESYIFNSEDDAMSAITYLQDCISFYGEATVADFKHFMGEGALNDDTEHVWTDMSTFEVNEGRFGWTISIPEPEKL